jgi:signal transduction histidine kinase
VSDAQLTAAPPPTRLSAEGWTPRISWRYVGAVVLLGLGYYGMAKFGQALSYTGSVSAIWPPVGLGIAVLYLRGLSLWPGIFLGELIVNGLLLGGSQSIPVGSAAGQQLGNMVEVIVGAWLLKRLIGPRARLDRAYEVVGMMAAVGAATAISATCGTLSMLAGGVIHFDGVLRFWRTWWLGDTAGALVVLPLILTWFGDLRTAWRRLYTVEGALLVVTVVALATVSVTSSAPLTYLIFPALIWAAFRFGPPGATLATAINAGLTIGITADSVGAFYRQPIDDRTLSTQLYVLTCALTGLFLSAVVSERERSVAELVESRRRESERALEERRRIARDLHDSVSQALFSSMLHARAAERALGDGEANGAPKLKESLRAIAELTRRAQREMRSFIFEWGPGGVGDGLVTGLSRHVTSLARDSGLAVDMQGPEEALPLSRATQAQLYGIAREALANVVKHSGAETASVRIAASNGHVVMEIADNGRGFGSGMAPPGHHGLESMRSRAREIDGELEVRSSPGHGTVVRIEVPSERVAERDGS